MSRLARTLGVVLALVFAVGTGLQFLAGNFHVVIPGQLYRSAQPTPEFLDQVARTQGIRTVINLRGAFVPQAEYDAECQRLQALGLRQLDVALVSYRLPTAYEVSDLIKALDEAVAPVLIHCESGMDRTGLAITLALLLRTDASPAQARNQLGLRYGHWRFGKARELDRFLDMYASWLHSTGRTHAPDHLRLWVRDVYDPFYWVPRTRPAAGKQVASRPPCQ